MSYPNSISARRAPRPSGLPAEPFPRHRPRRKPGRPPARQVPRRPPSPQPRPAPVRPPVVRPPLPKALPSAVARGVPISIARILASAGRFGLPGLAFGLGFALTYWILTRTPEEEAGPLGAIANPGGWIPWGFGTPHTFAPIYTYLGRNRNTLYYRPAYDDPTAPKVVDYNTISFPQGASDYGVPPTANMVAFWHVYRFSRAWMEASFKRPAPGDLSEAPFWVEPGDPIPGTGGVRTAPAPAAVPRHWIGGDLPWLTPVADPAPVTPAPRPIWDAPPRTNPWSPEMPDVGPRPNLNVDPITGGAVAPGTAPTINVSPGGNVQPRPNPHRWRRPPRGTKEGKARFGPVLSLIWRGVGQITEGIDLINAIYEGLPKRIKAREYKKRGRQPNPIERLDILYRNIDDLDVGKAIKNVIKNEIEDRVIGEFGKRLGNASKQSGRPIGFGAGPAL